MTTMKQRKYYEAVKQAKRITESKNKRRSIRTLLVKIKEFLR